jgi:hypothetical protein
MDAQRSLEAPRDGVPVAPPPVLHEAVPGHRPGHAWVPGYWDWKNGHHVWIAGHWEAARYGCHWRRHRWLRREGRWYLEPGGWVVDDLDSSGKRERLPQEVLR